ncbi:molybdenum cofactor biosynthesis protein B [Salibacterium salarium]|uniref:MogA/MoaB family molybdenum cofactor biosynthesis protein n=1 Tax=Salibacterium salarium TaxID=284579 RepID=UPI0027809661|nr:molybdenum cofactor biosynthesis protein B [Salibacterium salarium]MDQ0300182.1 molybdenum cofactor biosynthesis protein B [Salibacterium salarium]
MTVHEHKNDAPSTVNCAIITITDTRTSANDKSGQLIQDILQTSDYSVIDYNVIKDEYEDIQSLIQQLAENKRVNAILLNGGTGISKRDTTYEAVRDILDKEMPGFGELFRYLSYVEDIGSASILSRATAGVYNHTAIFSMPGSSGAVRLAMNRLILPELGHVTREIHKDL